MLAFLGSVLSFMSGIPLVKGQPDLLFSALIIVASGMVGGVLDLAWWKIINLKKRPEISFNFLLTHIGSITQIVFQAFYIKKYRPVRLL